MISENKTSKAIKLNESLLDLGNNKFLPNLFTLSYRDGCKTL